MWYIILMIIVAAVFVASIVLLAKRENVVYAATMIITLLGWVTLVTVLCDNTFPSSSGSVEGELRAYTRATAEKDILESGICLPFEIVADYSDDIVEMNRLIMKSRKYCGNWFLKPIYHKETAALELIDEKMSYESLYKSKN